MSVMSVRGQGLIKGGAKDLGNTAMTEQYKMYKEQDQKRLKKQGFFLK